MEKLALITGGDSGIGRAVTVHFAREGADVAIVYLDEQEDAMETKRLVESTGQKCLLLPGDVKSEGFCRDAVKQTVDEYGKLNILVNNAGMQVPQKDLKEISSEQLTTTFETNIYPYFYFAQAALHYLHEGDSIINTTSVTAYRSSPGLIDYSATKGAITTFTRSLATNLAEKKIRVNGVAPGPVWTPLIVSTFTQEKIDKFGEETAMKRAGEPSELGPAYVFLASDDASFITGQVIHVNGGEVVNG
ncbi:SDR family oxidoreductase [Puia sp. P3]|uniref:SDR family oxidoreductase n=1 Tax=Puia sp. P3 TaxID=3423952 RepID=UPI003D66DE5C